MAIDPNLSPYRLGFYNRNKNQISIEKDPLSREQAIQAVKDEYDPDDEDTDVFVAVFCGKDDSDGSEFYGRDEEATKKARTVSEDESDNESLPSSPPPSTSTPPLPDGPAAQAAIFFPVQENESDSQRQERADAESLFAKYPLTARNLWSRFHEPTKVEDTNFNIWDTSPDSKHATQGPEAARDMVRANIARMKDVNKVYELQVMEDLFKDDTG